MARWMSRLSDFCLRTSRLSWSLRPLHKAEEDFGAAFGEVHFKRDESEAFFGGAVGEFFHFAAVHEEFARPLGDVVEAVGLDIFGDVAAH